MVMNLVEAGRVVGLHRFPVKSMQGETLDEVRLGWHGLHGDRTWALQTDTDRGGLPWASARQYPELLRWRGMTDGDSDVHVVDPDGVVRDVRDPGVVDDLARTCATSMRMTHISRGAFDAMDVSVISTRSLASLGELLGEEDLDVRRFRPNIVVELTAKRPFPEDKLVGKTLVFGEDADPARIRLNRKDPRCKIVNLSPHTGEHVSNILGTIVKQRRNLLGAYGSVERPGDVRVGDTVYERR